VAVYDTGYLTDLSGLDGLDTVGGNISISANPALASIAALGNLTSFDGELVVNANPALISLAGLDNVTSVTRLSVADNDALTSLDGLEGSRSPRTR
jgi:hypothetical protein